MGRKGENKKEEELVLKMNLSRRQRMILLAADSCPLQSCQEKKINEISRSDVEERHDTLERADSCSINCRSGTGGIQACYSSEFAEIVQASSRYNRSLQGCLFFSF